jgi:hypothetical protein
MPEPLPFFFSRGTSDRADHVFDLLYRQWCQRYIDDGIQVDVTIEAPPAISCCIMREFPDLPKRHRKALLVEVMNIILDHADLLYREAEGSA